MKGAVPDAGSRRAPSRDAANVFPGSGEMAELCRSFDWSATTLGPIESWPRSLRTLAGTVVASPLGMVLLWGEDLVQVYNDAYRQVMGAKHPRGVGQPTRECWPEAWAFNGPIYEAVLKRGESFTFRDQRLLLERDGYPEETFFTLSYSPAPGDDGGVAGVLVTAAETTREVRARRATAAAQQAQARAEEHLRRTFEQVPLAIAVVEGPEHVYTLANARYLNHVRRKSLVGLALRQALPELEGGDTFDLMDDAYRTGEPFVASEVRSRLPRPAGDDDDRIVSFFFQPLRDASGSVYGIAIVIIDETRSVQARESLEESHRILAESEWQLRTFADAIPTLAWTARADGHIDWYNARWYEYTGATPQEMEGWGWQAVHDPEALPRVLERWTHSVASGEPFEMTFPLRGADGRYRSFLTRVSPLKDRDGRVVRWFGTNTDVEAERANRKRIEQLQALTAALAGARSLEDVAGVIVTEAARRLGCKTAVLLLLPPGSDVLVLASQTGLTLEEAERFALLPLVTSSPSSDCCRTAEPVWIERRRGSDGLFERYPKLADFFDDKGLHSVAAVPLAVAGRSVGAITFTFAEAHSFSGEDREFYLALGRQCAQAVERVRLLEAERAAADALREAQARAEQERERAETANRAKSDFLAVMSHELRTPLNAIGGYTQLLEMGLRGPVTPEQLHDLARIQKSQRHLLALINEVLNYARLESGTVRYEVAPLMLADVLADSEALIAPQVAARGLRYVFGGCDPGLRVLADRDKLQQILLNLLSNAVKFTPEGGGGRIELSCEVAGDAPDGPVHIHVRDSGVGIPPDKLESIFDPFVQVNTSLTRTTEGTGLGLAISRDLARGLGGDIYAESEPGEGSTFTVVLRQP